MSILVNIFLWVIYVGFILAGIICGRTSVLSTHGKATAHNRLSANFLATVYGALALGVAMRTENWGENTLLKFAACGLITYVVIVGFNAVREDHLSSKRKKDATNAE